MDTLMPDLKVCTDCAQYASNREVIDAATGEDVTAEHAARIQAEWDGWQDAATGRAPALVIDFEAEPISFATSSCDGCGEELAGTRYRAELIG